MVGGEFGRGGGEEGDGGTDGGTGGNGGAGGDGGDGGEEGICLGGCVECFVAACTQVEAMARPNITMRTDIGSPRWSP